MRRSPIESKRPQTRFKSKLPKKQKPIIKNPKTRPVSKPKKRALKRWDAIIEHVGVTHNLVGAEIGVDTGKTCKVLFERIPGLFLYLVDRWIETPEGDSYFRGAKKLCHEPQSYFDKAYVRVKDIAKPYDHKILKMDSVEAAKFVEDGVLDFCFIDGDHSYEGTRNDIEAWLPKVRTNGWLCGHDYDNQNTIGDVKTAVDEAFGDDIELSYNTTWFHKVTEKDHIKLDVKKIDEALNDPEESLLTMVPKG